MSQHHELRTFVSRLQRIVVLAQKLTKKASQVEEVSDRLAAELGDLLKSTPASLRRQVGRRFRGHRKSGTLPRILGPEDIEIQYHSRGGAQVRMGGVELEVSRKLALLLSLLRAGEAGKDGLVPFKPVGWLAVNLQYLQGKEGQARRPALIDEQDVDESQRHSMRQPSISSESNSARRRARINGSSRGAAGGTGWCTARARTSAIPRGKRREASRSDSGQGNHRVRCASLGEPRRKFVGTSRHRAAGCGSPFLGWFV